MMVGQTRPVITGLMLVVVCCVIQISSAEAQVAPSPRDIESYRGLHRAAHEGDAVAIRKLAREGADLEAKDRAGRTPLHVAVFASKDAVDDILGDRLPPLLTEPVFYLVGGGWRALARVHMALTDTPVKVAHGYELDLKKAREFTKKVWRLSPSEIAELPDVPCRRVKTLAAAGLVLDRVLKKLRPERIMVSALGLREGWLYAQLPEDERYLDPLVEGAQNFGLLRARVPSFGQALADWTADLFPGEAHSEKRLRVAACALSDIAWNDHRDVQAAQSFDRITRFPFVGIDHAERLWLAATVYARYNGDFGAPVMKPAKDVLSAAQLRQAEILGRAMVLAYRFSGSVPEILATAWLGIEADRVCLETTDAVKAPDSEAVQTRIRQLAKAVGVSRGEIVEV